MAKEKKDYFSFSGGGLFHGLWGVIHGAVAGGIIAVLVALVDQGVLIDYVVAVILAVLFGYWFNWTYSLTLARPERNAPDSVRLDVYIDRVFTMSAVIAVALVSAVSGGGIGVVSAVAVGLTLGVVVQRPVSY